MYGGTVVGIASSSVSILVRRRLFMKQALLVTLTSGAFLGRRCRRTLSCGVRRGE